MDQQLITESSEIKGCHGSEQKELITADEIKHNEIKTIQRKTAVK